MKGFCKCGCGRATGIWDESDRRKGRVRGQAKRFIEGH